MAFNFRSMFNRGGVLDAPSGGTPMDASQQPYQPPQQQQPNQSGFGGGQQSGPWGSAMQGGMNPGQGYFSQNNMGMYQGTPQRPFGMGNNPMMNMMNPYQGNMYGNYGNPNQRQPFMGNQRRGFE